MTFCHDRDGWPIGPDFLVRIEPATGGRKFRAWVRSWDPELGVLTVQCATRAHIRRVRPEECAVVPPSTLDRARRIGQEKTIKHVSERAQKARR